MAEIILSRGLVALCDDEDAELLSVCTWYANRTTFGGFYAQARLPGTGERLYMHRVVTKAPAGKHVHHISGDTLDNRKQNLSVLSPKAHQFEHHKEGESGVYFSRHAGRYRAAVRLHGARINLGLHDSEAVALRTVKLARRLLPGLPEEEMRETARRLIAASKFAA